YMQGLEFPWTF
nr:immunoglobulin light chain junction region [Macaca mulatta]MOV74866.1 immunoglobulin light chain junction region [Macaca mulatta]MOX52069.1 immunoglobulin light chain junction region [Macaca mulatta]